MLNKELKLLCLPRLLLICKIVGLSEKEEKVIIHRCNKRKDVITTSYELNMCETSVKKYYSSALKRIEDYKNYLQINSLQDIKE